MLSRTQLALWIAFTIALGVWTGAAVHESIGRHPAWWAEPVRYIRTAVVQDGTINAWPFTTAALALFTLGAAAALIRYRGPGRRDLWIVLGGVFVILVATGVYFVPTLGRLADHGALTDAQIIEMSRAWMQLNFARTIALLGLFAYALVALLRTITPPIVSRN